MTTPIENKPQLTDKQQLVLSWIVEFIQLNRYPPSNRELQKAFGFKSQTAALAHLKALKAKGCVSWVAGKQRTLTVP
jgi:repressor LexA